MGPKPRPQAQAALMTAPNPMGVNALSLAQLLNPKMTKPMIMASMLLTFGAKLSMQRTKPELIATYQ